MTYLIIGAGGTGGLIGGYLAKAGKGVTLVARGTHLHAIQQKGLTIRTYGEPPFTVGTIRAVSEAELNAETFDVVFVCVKAYSLPDIVPMLRSVSRADTLIIPILNSLEAGNFLRIALPDYQVYDGCVYLTGYVSAPGEVSQNNKIFRIVYGLNHPDARNQQLRERMEGDVRESGIGILYSSTITSDIFKKLTFTSAFACAAAYDNKQAADLQQPGTFRELFKTLLQELDALAKGANLKINASIVDDNLAILDSLSPDFTASIQKDLKQGKPDEREQLIFDIVRLAQKHNVDVPEYRRIAGYFGLGD
ncbi:ketopantoate reductase family protein [Spirosoma sp. KUDC1026]|uniref:ketopantoate reductase family protein n=1 Tax=Spirosoma sp. KUDC1026 TaxID=2745947 RepID=UPI00159BE646|nr:2-dehydropantoate 2-reductase [Spirosoma sp. KUDC1026]QKZ12902.1 2-dehydropantoate 2-reductase [Spirosoma sp. KUDC1026]